MLNANHALQDIAFYKAMSAAAQPRVYRVNQEVEPTPLGVTYEAQDFQFFLKRY